MGSSSSLFDNLDDDCFGDGSEVVVQLGQYFENCIRQTLVNLLLNIILCVELLFLLGQHNVKFRHLLNIFFEQLSPNLRLKFHEFFLAFLVVLLPFIGFVEQEPNFCENSDIRFPILRCVFIENFHFVFQHLGYMLLIEIQNAFKIVFFNEGRLAICLQEELVWFFQSRKLSRCQPDARIDPLTFRILSFIDLVVAKFTQLGEVVFSGVEIGTLKQNQHGGVSNCEKRLKLSVVLVCENVKHFESLIGGALLN